MPWSALHAYDTQLQFGSILEILKMTVSFVLHTNPQLNQPSPGMLCMHMVPSQVRTLQKKRQFQKTLICRRQSQKSRFNFFYIFYKSEMKLKTSSRQWLVDKGSPIHLGPLPILSLIDLDNE